MVTNEFHMSIIVFFINLIFPLSVSAIFDPVHLYEVFYGQLHEPLSVKVSFYSNPRTVINQVHWMNKTSGEEMFSSQTLSFGLIDDTNITQ